MESMQKIPDWWRPQDGDPAIELLLKYLDRDDQITIVTQVIQNDIAVKEQNLKLQKMAVEMLKRGRKVE